MDSGFESRIVSLFVVDRKKERAAFELASPKKRKTFVWSLPGFIDCRFAKEITEPVADSDAVSEILENAGFSDRCYVISVDGQTDGIFRDLKGALNDVVGYGPALVVDAAAELAFLECEQEYGAPKRFILRRGISERF